MGLTTDPNDPRLGHGADSKPVPQNEVYLILSEEERAKGFVRPVRCSYKHIGHPGPKYPTRPLTGDEQERWAGQYVAFEPYPESEMPRTGRFWTKGQLDKVGQGCGVVTTMGVALAETYSRQPTFYGTTYCCGCSRHLSVEEFVWEGTTERVGS